MSRTLFSGILVLSLLGCQTQGEPTRLAHDETGASAGAGAPGGLRTVSFPEEDPGPPFYARVGLLLNQIFHDGEYVAIPFMRDPACVPLDFNLLESFHVPGPDGPGAFGCSLVVSGRFLIEPDAAPGTFPFQVSTSGPARVWFVPWATFAPAIEDGHLTMAELLSLQPLRGTAERFDEMLRPRFDNHHVVITSHGRLDDGRRFQFNVNHLGDVTQSILIRIR